MPVNACLMLFSSECKQNTSKTVKIFAFIPFIIAQPTLFIQRLSNALTPTIAEEKFSHLREHTIDL
jgi:hypothetical protein